MEIIYKEALEIDKFRKHCVDNILAGCLWRYEKLFRKACKVIKKEKKKRKKIERNII